VLEADETYQNAGEKRRLLAEHHRRFPSDKPFCP
jgi:hypothetical protein